MSRKYMYTVRQAVEMAYARMDDKFHSIRFCQAVREIRGSAFLMDGTILRRLREAREENPEIYGYVVEDHEASIYKKKALKKAELV